MLYARLLNNLEKHGVLLDFTFSDAMIFKLFANIFRDIFAISIHDAFCVTKCMDFQTFWEWICDIRRDFCMIFKSMTFEGNSESDFRNFC